MYVSKFHINTASLPESFRIRQAISGLINTIVCSYLINRSVPRGRQPTRKVSTTTKNIGDPLSFRSRQITHYDAVPAAEMTVDNIRL